ncbi:MAG: LOG family protein, partial [Lentisphaeria bacterium]|nr:LOG family protein [Lentisphaeria bacterium]
MKKNNIQNVAVYLGSADIADPEFRQAVMDLANYLAENDMTLVFGGSNTGMMTLLADSMLANNGKIVGVFTKSLPERFIRHDLTEAVITENLAERKAEMLKRADAIVALPGSIGTFDELFDALAQKK